jgi:hypothetical protein
VQAAAAMTDKAPQESHATKVQQMQAQLEAIELEQEIKASQALTSELKDLDPLCQQCTGEDASKFFDLGIQALQLTCSKMRTIRGDGNCYYRAILYSLCGKLLSVSVVRRMLLRVSNSGSLEATLSRETF